MQVWFDKVLNDTISFVDARIQQVFRKWPKEKVVVVLAGGLGSSNQYVKNKFDELVRSYKTVQVRQNKR